MIKYKGFTLVEMLVVIGILSIVGVLVVAIFVNTLRGSNKSLIVSSIKQNGQAVLETMDKTIRNAEGVICIGAKPDDIESPNNTIVIRNKKGEYTRYRFDIDESKSTNGAIYQDNPVRSPTEAIQTFEARVCQGLLSEEVTLTDTRTQYGVRLLSGSFKNEPPGLVNIQFVLAPGIKAPQVLTGQIEPVTFRTTVQLR